MARLTIERLHALNDRPERIVTIDAWNGDDVAVRGLTAQQINQCNRRAEDPRRGGEINPEIRNGWYLVEGMIDPKIDIAEAEHWLTERSFGPVGQVLTAILEESGLAQKTRDAAKSEDAPESDARPRVRAR